MPLVPWREFMRAIVGKNTAPSIQIPMGLDGLGFLPYSVPMAKIKGAECAAEDIQKLPFEEALKKLEAIVEAMEAQDLPLESLLARYQEGTALAQLCQARLNEAELKIQQLEKSGKGELTLKPAPHLEEQA
jgi:exodeoxyribonuclease VII small subunit